MSERNHGTGSLYRRADGKWVAQVMDPVTGKKVRKYAARKADAQQHLEDLRARLSGGLLAATSRTKLRDYLTGWIERQPVPGPRAESTLAEYERRLRQYVIPVLGGVQLGKLNRRHIADLYAVMLTDGRSKSTIEGTRNALSAAISDAVDDELITANPVRSVSIPSTARAAKKVKPPSRETVLAMLDAANDENPELARIIIVLAGTGIRVGECMGLKWADFDAASGRLHIARTVTIDRQRRIKLGESAKSYAGERDLIAGETVRAALREQRKHVTELRLSQKRWTDHDLMFPTSIGTVTDPRKWRKVFDLAAENVPAWRGSFHQFRHYAATTLLLDPDVPDLVVSRMLGHASIRTTADTYGHLVETAAKRASSTLDEALGG